MLAKVSVAAFGRLLFEYYGLQLSEEEKSWFAIDGKELRGSILPGHTRGEAVALAVRHEDKATYGLSFFNGSKQSEVTAVRDLLVEPLLSQKMTMDALHFKPATLIPIHKAGGVFVVGLKENQPELLAEMQFCSQQLCPTYTYQAPLEKGHGRIDQRNYWCYDIEKEYFDKRWKQAGFKYLIKVRRKRQICNINKHSQQDAYFLSNKNVQDQQDARDLFDAVRAHWQVECVNHSRDSILKEDKLRCIETDANRTMALCRTLAIKILNQAPSPNRCETMESFADHFDQCINFLKQINFL